MFDFNQSDIFAQADEPGDYENRGWVCLINKHSNHAALMTFSHNSCYGTWEAIDGDDPVWDGTIGQMVSMAIENRDPSLPARIRDDQDRPDSLLDDLYSEIQSRKHELAEFIGPQWEIDMKYVAEVGHDEIVEAIKAGVSLPEGWEVGEIEIVSTPTEEAGKFKLDARVEMKPKEKA
jgi:hypothetical protein